MSNYNPMARTPRPTLGARLAIEDIAKENLSVSCLDSRDEEELDFHEIHVDALKKALHRAYNAGFKAAQEAKKETI